MSIDPFASLAAILRTLPGVGFRQARRMAEHLARLPQSEVEQLIASIRAVSESLVRCPHCRRFFASPSDTQRTPLCSLCADPQRISNQLMVVAKDIDLITFEQSGTYQGHYFVLGTLLTFTTVEDRARLPLRELRERVRTLTPGGEVIIALGVTADAEVTARVVAEEIAEHVPPRVTVSILGRGLSTGTEIEYADPHTLSCALAFRRPVTEARLAPLNPAESATSDTTPSPSSSREE